MSNRLYLWGDNSVSQIGNTNLGTQNSPLLIAPSINVVDVGGYHTIGTSGVARTYVGCGDNSQLQLSSSGPDNTTSAKTPFRSLSNNLPANIIQVEAGLQHSLYLTLDGTVTGRGNNTYGQTDPAPFGFNVLSNNGPYVNISAGNYHNIALNAVGQAYIWGRNNYGQIGNGTSGSVGSFLHDFSQANGVKYVAAGDYHTAIITGDNRLLLCGLNNRGQLGDNTQSTRLSFVYLGGTLFSTIPPYWSKVSLGTQHSAGITTGGDLYTWGYNLYGQLGLGDTTNRSIPTLVSRIDGHAWTEVSAGNGYTLAINANGDVYAWGLNNTNQLGDGTATDRILPTKIISTGSLGLPVAIKAGPGYHSAALFNDTTETTTTTTTTGTGTSTTTTTTTTTTISPQIVGSCISRGSFSKIQLRRATNAQFVSANTILASGEPGYATDTRVIKVGDGYTPWSALLPVNISGTIDFPTLLASNNINISSVGNNYIIAATGLAQQSHQHVTQDLSNIETLYQTTIFSNNPNNGILTIDWHHNKRIQTTQLNGTSISVNKGSGWPSSLNLYSVEMILEISVISSQTSVNWTNLVNAWYSSPPNPLPIGTHSILLRAMSNTINGYYQGSK